MIPEAPGSGARLGNLSAWIGLIGDASLPLCFFAVWALPELQSDDKVFSLALTLYAEMYMLAIVAFYGSEERNQKFWFGVSLELIALAAMAAIAGLMGYVVTAITFLSLSSRYIGMVWRRDRVKGFPATEWESIAAFALLVALVLLVNTAGKHGVLLSEHDLHGPGWLGAWGTFYYGIILAIRIAHLARAPRPDDRSPQQQPTVGRSR